MQFIPTNDCFHHLLNLLRLRDKDFIIELFESQGIEVTKAKIKAWSTKTGGTKPGYREMPRECLDAFISELYSRKLVIDDNEL